MAALSGRRRALLRLLGLQATWTYERMQGVGIGHASEPVLRGLFADDPVRYREALGRAAGFYNANPFLAALVVGAEARAERDGVPGPTIERLRAALCGPLGALGDRLFWASLVPGGASAALALVTLGAGVWPVGAFVLAHNLGRWWLGHHLLELGWRHGLQVGAAVLASPLPRIADRIGPLTAVVAGAAVPLAVRWLLPDLAPVEWVGLAACLVGAGVYRWIRGPRASTVRLTLLGGVAVLLWHWGTS